MVAALCGATGIVSTAAAAADPTLDGRELSGHSQMLMPWAGSAGSQSVTGTAPPATEQAYAYVPGKRRDPFMPVISERAQQANRDRSPLQRVPLGDLTLIGVVWGGFGSRAMVQTPDGRGYTIQQGTLVGPNHGVVTGISEDAVTIEERMTEVSGRKLIREHVALVGAGFGEIKDKPFRAGVSAEEPYRAVVSDMPTANELTRPERPVYFAALSNTTAGLEGTSQPGLTASYAYNPLGRRDPFAPVIRESGPAHEADMALPPLQRVTLPELTLIGIIWGGFGYSAMVQTPDGKGYTVSRGTVVGPNNGVVTAISETGITVEERFSDLYGRKQVRELTIPLRSREKTE